MSAPIPKVISNVQCHLPPQKSSQTSNVTPHPKSHLKRPMSPPTPKVNSRHTGCMTGAPCPLLTRNCLNPICCLADILGHGRPLLRDIIGPLPDIRGRRMPICSGQAAHTLSRSVSHSRSLTHSLTLSLSHSLPLAWQVKSWSATSLTKSCIPTPTRSSLPLSLSPTMVLSPSLPLPNHASQVRTTALGLARENPYEVLSPSLPLSLSPNPQLSRSLSLREGGWQT